jgi:hypothetical protein
MIAVWTGLVAGSLHVVSGPDHIAAMAPIAMKDPRRALRMGTLWGLGHGLAVLALGALGVWARGLADLDAISAWSEYLVGFMLIGLGLWAIRGAGRITTSDHGHAPAAFGVGLLHGAAGAGHLFGILPAMALPREMAAAYLVAYFLAAVGAMAGFGLLLGRVAELGSERFMRRLMWACGLVALAVGVLWLCQSSPMS